ncbi:MAG TPA: efflux RND transporter periplasmic adaptor subunit [Rhodocyclaceae bacterium]|nr:efflux RND transporter periplasmic adaptor subunit [Rhodocyclaceae bacterium]
MKKFKTPLLVALLAAVIGSSYWYFNAAGKSAAGNAPKTAGPVPVTVAKATAGEVPVLLEVVGRAEAYESVSMKSRVDGQVESVAYTEGQQVKQGDVLLRLDPGDFNAKLLQAEANLAKDQAMLVKARADVERYVSLKSRGFVSDEKVNEVRTSEAAAAATVKADEAAVQLARLQLSYTTLRAPFSGVVGARLVFPGSSVKVNDTVLAVLNRVQPLYVTFSVPEKHLQKLRQAMGAGPMKVLVRLPGGRGEPMEGQARFLDNAVDAATGTIQMKALLDNKVEKLTPGQFLNVAMTLDKLDNAVLVPADAVQQGNDGNFLYAVKPDNTVELRKIDIQATYRGMAAIGKGVAAGDTVVTDGQLRLTPGATVKAKGPETAPEANKATQPKPAA